MNSEIASYPAADAYSSFEVTVGAPLCDLMRRYSDATEEPVDVFAQSTYGHLDFSTELDLSTCCFGRAEHGRLVDLQLAVA